MVGNLFRLVREPLFLRRCGHSRNASGGLQRTQINQGLLLRPRVLWTTLFAQRLRLRRLSLFPRPHQSGDGQGHQHKETDCGDPMAEIHR